MSTVPPFIDNYFSNLSFEENTSDVLKATTKWFKSLEAIQQTEHPMISSVNRHVIIDQLRSAGIAMDTIKYWVDKLDNDNDRFD